MSLESGGGEYVGEKRLYSEPRPSSSPLMNCDSMLSALDFQLGVGIILLYRWYRSRSGQGVLFAELSSLSTCVVVAGAVEDFICRISSFRLPLKITGPSNATSGREQLQTLSN